ncbi:MAG: rRNA maturation RNase YbeY [Myxococcota bacterium]
MPVQLQNRRKAPRVASPWVRSLATALLDALDEQGSELSVVLTDDLSIRALNREHRNKDKATDVLSFSQIEGPVFPGESRVLGDVVISMETAARQAREIGHSLEDEVRRLLIHGALHLLGHDHVNGGPQARKMKREEDRLERALASVP